MNVGIVGRDDETADGQPVVAVPAAGGEDDRRRETDQGLLRRLAAGKGLGRCSDGRQVIGRGVGRRAAGNSAVVCPGLASAIVVPGPLRDGRARAARLAAFAPRAPTKRPEKLENSSF